MLRPTGKKILVEIQENKKNGILIVNAHKDEPKKAKVLCLGDKTEIPTKMGDFLLINPFAGRKVSFEKDQEKIAVIDDHDVIGIIND